MRIFFTRAALITVSLQILGVYLGLGSERRLVYYLLILLPTQ
jgi:hypothetical protein